MFSLSTRLIPKYPHIITIFFILALTASCTHNPDQISEWQVEGGPQDNYAAIQIKLWMGVPPQSLNGTLVVVLGSGMNGLHLADDPGWRHLARSHGLALVSLNMVESGGLRSWHEADQGSGEGFLQCLEEVYSHLDLKEAAWKPIHLVGLSTGGQFAYHLALQHPERMGSFVTLKGGYHRLPIESDLLLVPGLLVSGEKDMPFRLENLRQVAQEGQRLSAPWTWLIDPGTGHESERVSKLIPVFLNTKLDKTHVPTDPAFPSQIELYRNNPDSYPGTVLSLKSVQPSAIAIITPSRLDLGAWQWDQGSQSQVLTLAPVKNDQEPLWDRIEVHSLRSLYSVKSSNQPDGSIELTVSALPSSRPMSAPIQDKLQISYFKGIKKLLGYDAIPLNSRSTSELKITPASLLMGSLNREQKSFEVRLSLTGNKGEWKFHSIATEGGVEIIKTQAIPSFTKCQSLLVDIKPRPNALGMVYGTLIVRATSPTKNSICEAQIPVMGQLSKPND